MLPALPYLYYGPLAAQAYNQVDQAPHKAELSHELIAGAAAFEAARGKLTALIAF